MKILCRLGIHDWEILDIDITESTYHEDRVCLRCNKMSLKLTEYIN